MLQAVAYHSTCHHCFCCLQTCNSDAMANTACFKIAIAIMLELHYRGINLFKMLHQPCPIWYTLDAHADACQTCCTSEAKADAAYTV